MINLTNTLARYQRDQDRRVTVIGFLQEGGWVPVCWSEPPTDADTFSGDYIPCDPTEAHYVQCPCCKKLYKWNQHLWQQRHLQDKHGYTYAQAINSLNGVPKC